MWSKPSPTRKKHGVHFAVYYSLWDRRWDRKARRRFTGKTRPRPANKAYVDYIWLANSKS